ncbi:MAG TPA: prolipoprotein diacylglyceryl transferase [Steroidobacteraceae bacterium]|jgi:phosphatidylglycerol:prolipoprotein diacylglycerol transferase|nr:prolipoprotein diacylglyceryl transferase [Steroidobacteraceae bacterium]
MIPYPSIDPVLVSIGPFGPVGPFLVRWYGLMYVIGFGVGWWLGRRRASQRGSSWTVTDVDDVIFFAALGVIVGGRIGWVLFYGFMEFMRDPVMLFRIWEGGMSFHGGLLGALASVAIFARRRQRNVGDVFDFLAPLPGFGLFAGRVGNFINGELWGKPTDVPWGFTVDPAVLHQAPAAEAHRLCERFAIDPCVLHVHASQLYEGLLEGLVLFVILWVFTAKPRPRLAPSGLFLLFYGVFRFAVEFVRVPDENRGYLLFDWVTMGQILSTPMILAGLVLLAIAYRRNQPSGNLQIQTS